MSLAARHLRCAQRHVGLASVDFGQLQFSLQIGWDSNFVDGQLYWAADANGPKRSDEVYDRGIFPCCAPADLADSTKRTLLFQSTV